MKLSMRVNFFLITFLLGSFICLEAQSIRKDYREMTAYEKSELIDAFYEIRSGPDLFNDIADFHLQFFDFSSTLDPTRLDIHLNLPSEPERDIFFPWHRRQMLEMEQAIQEINPKISLAYWNSSTDQSTTSELWDEDFMGSFDTTWSLGRNLDGTGELISPTDLTTLLSETDFYEFANDLERNNAHAGPHRWTGGVMRTTASSRDPVFYLHHSYIDKLWQDWEEVNESSSFVLTSMLRYDGTYVFDGVTYPSVNPNDITDSRFYGVFYANDGSAILDNYIVSNTYHAEEYFYYQFYIELKDDFLIPAGRKCKIESVNEIRLNPGFVAESGSETIIAIDSSLPLSGASSKKVREKNPYDFIADLKPIVWEESDKNDDTILITAFPNPFTEHITIKLDKPKDCIIEVFNMMGMLVKTERFQNTDKIVINDLYGLSTGSYVLNLKGSDGELILAKRVVKL